MAFNALDLYTLKGDSLSLEDLAKGALFSLNLSLFNGYVKKGYAPDKEDWEFLKTYALKNNNAALYIQSCKNLPCELDYSKLQRMISLACESGDIEHLNHIEKEHKFHLGLRRKSEALMMRALLVFSKKVKTLSKVKARELFEKRFLNNSDSWYVDYYIGKAFLIICHEDLVKLRFWLILKKDILAAEFCEDLINDSSHFDWLLFGD